MSFPLSYNSINFVKASSHYIDCTTNAILAVGETAGSQASYSAWFNISANPSGPAVICTKYTGGGTGGGMVPYVDTNGQLTVAFHFNTHATTTRATGTVVTDGKWHHVVCTNNATGNSRVYLDGALKTDDANNDFLRSSSTLSFYIGGEGAVNNFNGQIADVRVFATELLASEIQNLFKAIEVARGLVCRFPFREGGGTTTGDTCNGITGTLTNGPTWSDNVPLLPSVYVPPVAPPPTGSQTGPRNQYYCWVTTWNTTAGTGTDPQVYISHELTELITDPDANVAASGWTSTNFCPAGSLACEICDQCELTTGVGNYTSLVNGVNCWSSSYYSNKGGGCSIPEIVSPTASSNQTFAWGGGKLLNNVTVCLIFSGSGWTLTNSASPTLGSADDIKRGVQTLIIGTSFYDRLSEYSVNKPTFQFAAINSTTVVPNPFREEHIQQVIKDCVAAGTVPNPASMTDTLVFVVILNSTPHYFVNAQIGNHSQFQFTPPPPTNIPTANAPGSGQASVGPVSPSLQGDQWDVTKIYPDKTTGNFSSAWFLPTNPNSDSRHVVDSTTFTANADGSYRNTQTNVVYNIAQQNGFNEAGLTLNQATLVTQKFMQDNKDWTNTEVTLYARINSVANTSHSGPPSIVIASPGARETNDSTLLGTTGLPKSCEASDYRMYIEPISGIIRFQKDLQYTAGLTSNASDPVATSPAIGLTKWSNQFTGLKFVNYNLSDGQSVALELWMDYNGNNIWTQILRYVDSANGNWSITSNACGGTTNQTVSWGGPLIQFIWNNISSVDIKWASVREIDVYALNPALLVPPAVTQPTGTPTSSPGNNLPANPPPPNQAPPTNPQTGNLDKFGVKMLYPSLSGGQSWYLSNRGLKGDSRVSGIPNNVREFLNGDGSFHMTSTFARFYVATLAGYSYQSAGGMSVNHALCRVRQYMQSPRDWKNVEVTLFVNIDMFDPAPYPPKQKLYDVGIKARTGSHSRIRDCQGCAYEIQSQLFPGSEKFFHRKEHWHDTHADTDRQGITYSFASAFRRWFGQKFVVYNMVDTQTGHVTGVRMEHYWNDNGDGVTWVKVNSTVDNGGWGFLGGLCGGFRDEVIVWGGPLVGFFWNDMTGVCYKWMSIREIDTSPIVGNPPGGPPSTSPPGGPPPQPPKIVPVVGPDVYNVFKFLYNVQLDDSGGCGGLDPLAHLGETQLGITVPGTANQVNLANTAGAAFLAGEQIKSASSVLYNKCIAEVVVNLRIVGLPSDYATQPVYCTIRRGYDNLKVVDLGQIQVNQLTSQYQPISFKTPSMPNWSTTYNLAGSGFGDIIAIEYYGGNSSNYLQVQTDNSSGFDGTNGIAVDVIVGSSTVSTLTGIDMTSSYWGTGQTGVQPTLAYNVPSTYPGTSFASSVAAGITSGVGIWAQPLGLGGSVAIAQRIISASSILNGKTIYEIDVFIFPPSPNTATGSVHVYIYDENTAAIKADFGSKPVADMQPGWILVPFFCYTNTFPCALNTRIIVEYVGDDAATAGVSVGISVTTTGGPIDGVNSNAYLSSDGQAFKLFFIPNTVGATSSLGDLCALMWTSATPPVGGLPPTIGGNTVTIGNPLLLSPPTWTFLGGLIGYQATAAGIVVQDSQSKLFGKIIRGIDVSVAQNHLAGVDSPQGVIYAAVNKADGTFVGQSASYDVSQLSTVTNSFGQVRFTISLTNPAGYKLQAGDKILIWYAAALSGPLNKSTQPGIVLALTGDVFDGAHTQAVVFSATGVSATSKLGGFTGPMSVLAKNDLVCNIYFQ